MLKPGDDGTGIIITSLLSLYQPGQAASFIGAVVGAIVLLGIVCLVTKAAK